MHSSSCEPEGVAPSPGGSDVFVAIAALVTEGRTPVASAPKKCGFSEGPHCPLPTAKAPQGHVCNADNALCIKYETIRSYVLSLWQKSLPLCIDVLLVPKCCCDTDLICNPSTSLEPIGTALLLEQWHINVLHRRTHDFSSTNMNINQLLNALRSQLYFSQISAWLATPDEKIRSDFKDKCVVYCLTVPGETYGCTKFASSAQNHTFPSADLTGDVVVRVSLTSLPRTETIPLLKCSKCEIPRSQEMMSVLDDRMQTSCTLKGKHRCEDYEEFDSCRFKMNYFDFDGELPSTSEQKQLNYLVKDGKSKHREEGYEKFDSNSANQRFKRNYLPKIDYSNRPSTSEQKLQLNSLVKNVKAKNLGEGYEEFDCSSTNQRFKRNYLSKIDYSNRPSTSEQKLQLNSLTKDVEEFDLKRNYGLSKTNCLAKGIYCEKNKYRCEDYKEFDTFRKNYPSTSVCFSKDPCDSTNQHLDDLKKKFNNETATSGQEMAKSKQLNCLAKELCQLDSSKVDLELSQKEFVEVLSVLRKSAPKTQNMKRHDLVSQSKGDILLDAIIRSSKVEGGEEGVLLGKMLAEDDGGGTGCKRKCGVGKTPALNKCEHEARVGDNKCDKNDSISDNNYNCDNLKRKKTDYIKLCDISNVFSLEYLEKRQKVKVKQKITFDEDSNDKYNNSNCEQESINREIHSNGVGGIPSALEQAKFRKSLDSAASMVFHSRTGLPLTSSPAPVRRGKSCFDFDSSINSVSAIRSALFSLASCSADEDSESDCSIVSPCSPDATNGLNQRESPTVIYKHRGQSSGLLGSFVESVLNGRLEPVSTVHGFSAELGASGSFCPRHVVLPVTVFFYTLGDNDKVSTPYLGHINLGKKGYSVPKLGTIQVTLFNPLGTVVKMFVIMYDLSDMPPNSQTFIRQRTLFMPANCEDKNLEWSQKWLRYLIHLRFMSSKSGRIYLHSDIRMIICRKSDLDTATAHGFDMSYELRSFINSPTNPRFSPRK